MSFCWQERSHTIRNVQRRPFSGICWAVPKMPQMRSSAMRRCRPSTRSWRLLKPSPSSRTRSSFSYTMPRSFAPERSKRRKMLPSPPRTAPRMHCLPCSLIFRRQPTSFLRSAQSPTSGERFTAPSKRSAASWNPKPCARGTSSIGSVSGCARWGAACTQKRAHCFSMSSV